MNILSYRETAEHGLSFELLVDEQPISALIGAWDTSIPYWLLDYDLPHLSAHDDEYEPDMRIVTVASCCGEYSCGNARCRVVREKDTVVFCDFAGEGAGDGRMKVFRFSHSNYGSVVLAMTRRAKEHIHNEHPPSK